MIEKPAEGEQRTTVTTTPITAKQQAGSSMAIPAAERREILQARARAGVCSLDGRRGSGHSENVWRSDWVTVGPLVGTYRCGLLYRVLEPPDNPFGPRLSSYVAATLCKLCLRAGPMKNGRDGQI